MKKIIITISFLVNSLAFSQEINYGYRYSWESKNGEIILISEGLDSNSNYLLYYRNLEYSRSIHVNFIDTGPRKSSMYFFESILSIIDNDVDLVYNVGKDIYLITKRHNGAKISCSLGYFIITKKEVKNLISIL